VDSIFGIPGIELLSLLSICHGYATRFTVTSTYGTATRSARILPGRIWSQGSHFGYTVIQKVMQDFGGALWILTFVAQSLKILNVGVCFICNLTRTIIDYARSDIDEYLPPITLEWCQQQMTLFNIDLSDLQTGELDDSGNRLHVKAYHYLHHAIKAHIESRELPILCESTIPRGGYDAVMSRNGALSNVIRENYAFVQNVRSSGVTPQFPIAQDLAPEWEFIGDANEDRGWLQPRPDII